MSPVYWVSCVKKVGSLVGVELQHCALVWEEGQWSGLSFAVCNVEKAEPPYQFELHGGQFSSRSSYERLEVKFSGRLEAIIRWIIGSSDAMLFTKLYYQQQKESKSTAHVSS